MARHTIPIDRYMEAAQVFHWATKEHFVLWFTGVLSRHRRTESVLHRLVQKDKLRCVQYGKRLVYVVPRRTKGGVVALAEEKAAYEAGATEKAVAGLNKIVHGLACTEGLVRFWRSRMDGEIIPERYFYGLGAVPEWGIRYSDGKLLLFEFCTESNFHFSNMMNGKLNAYKNYLPRIEKKFQGLAMVLFVIDVARDKVERFVLDRGKDEASETPPGLFFATDYETFLRVPIGEQLTTPIYFWSHDGRLYPLSQNA